MQEVIRKAILRDGKSKRQVAQELGIHRNTVSRLLKSSGPERYALTQPKTKPVIDSVLPIIEAWLQADEQAPRKQRHTARRVFERLCDEYGFTGSERRIREVVAELKQKPKEVFLPLAFEPGEMAQVDWIEGATVRIGGESRKINIFGMVLNYSGAFYFEAFERRTQECFFQGHVSAFLFLGGVPLSITYDNLKTAVNKVLQGKNREETDGFVSFRSGWLFDSVFCQPAKGNEKGRVENMVKFVERNILTPVPGFESLEALNIWIKEKCLAYQNHTQERQVDCVGERLKQELNYLLPIPIHPPECCRILAVKADKSALVQFETNKYSVPSDWAYRDLWLKVFVDRVEITDSERVIATHKRLSGRFEESILFSHYRKILERKPGARKHLRAVGKEDGQEARQEAFRPRYPQVYVQPPNLAQYRQLLRNPDYDSSPSHGYASQETALAQRAKTLP